jgi:acetyl-CoA carboxylase carboxyl transferase subunit beta
MGVFVNSQAALWEYAQISYNGVDYDIMDDCRIRFTPLTSYTHTQMATIAMSSNSAESNSWKNMLKRPKKGVPEGLWIRCPGCQQTIFRKEAEKNLNVCPECGDHWYVSARQRIVQVLDAGTFEERFDDLFPADPLNFVDPGSPYPQRIEREQKRTGLREAVIVGTGMIRARRVAFGVTDSGFMMGSMGSVVGEKLTRIIELAIEQQLPLIIISGSGGGARMHEGILSLMQMAKTSAALARFDAAGGLFISVLTHPTMGGVAASFASLGDVIFAEPNAMIGFAGPRVIKAAIRMELPKGFQTSEFLLEHGFIDRIVRRKDLKSELARTIDYCGK